MSTTADAAAFNMSSVLLGFLRVAARRRRLLFTLPAVFILMQGGVARAEERPVKSLLEMRHQNVVIQKWDLSCGAAALTTLLNYQHGERLTEKEVAVALMKRPEYIDHPELIQIREGFSLLDLKRYAEARGYKGVGLGKMELKDLIERAPVLVPIKIQGYNHFVVFRGIKGNRALVADPAWGNRTLLIEQFMENWIDYPAMGKVAFAVERRDGAKAAGGGLQPHDSDYVMLR